MPGGGLGSSKGLCGHGGSSWTVEHGVPRYPERGYRGTEEDGSGLVEEVSTGVGKTQARLHLT